jgi:hypothetical protein
VHARRDPRRQAVDRQRRKLQARASGAGRVGRRLLRRLGQPLVVRGQQARDALLLRLEASRDPQPLAAQRLGQIGAVEQQHRQLAAAVGTRAAPTRCCAGRGAAARCAGRRPVTAARPSSRVSPAAARSSRAASGCRGPASADIEPADGRAARAAIAGRPPHRPRCAAARCRAGLQPAIEGRAARPSPARRARPRRWRGLRLGRHNGEVSNPARHETRS